MGQFACQPVPRTEDPCSPGGKCRRHPLPMRCHALCCALARARGIVNIDARSALPCRAPAVLTGEDWAAGVQSPSSHVATQAPTVADSSRPVRAARDRAVVVGDPVAFVVAETFARARDAAEHCGQYEPLPAPAATDGSAPGAPALWPGCPDNETFFYTLGTGRRPKLLLRARITLRGCAWSSTRHCGDYGTARLHRVSIGAMSATRPYRHAAPARHASRSRLPYCGFGRPACEWSRRSERKSA
jgi:hypothetical protein